MLDLSYAFSWARWKQRFQSEQHVREHTIAEGRAPDATVDEVGATQENLGFEGRPLGSDLDPGQGTGNPGSPSWAGWGL